MFSALQKEDSSRVFRFSVVLKEEIEPEKLKAAVKRTMEHLPAFSYRFKKGFFWGYLEKTDILPNVTEDDKIISQPRWLGKNGGPELEVLYYKRRLTLEFSHVLTDGSGAVAFTKTLLKEYFSDVIPFEEDEEVSFEELTENAYKRHYNKNSSAKRESSNEKVFVIDKIQNENTARYFSGLMPVSQLKEKSKSRGMTITEYLAAVYVYAIIQSAKEAIDKPIALSIPINFRGHFPSKTVRNFSGDTSLKYTGKTQKDISFEDVCEDIKGKLKNGIDKNIIQGFINGTYSLTVNPILRIVPFVIKQPVLDASQKKNHADSMTSILTNLGNISFGEVLDSKIERLECVGGDIRIYGLTTMASVVSFNGYLNLFLNSSVENTTLFRDFFKTLSEDGVDVRVESSHDNGFDLSRKSETGKRCQSCGVDLGEEYTVCPLCKSKATEEKKHIEGFETAAYSSEFKERNTVSAAKTAHKPSFEKLRAFFNL